MTKRVDEKGVIDEKGSEGKKVTPITLGRPTNSIFGIRTLLRLSCRAGKGAGMTMAALAKPRLQLGATAFL